LLCCLLCAVNFCLSRTCSLLGMVLFFNDTATTEFYTSLSVGSVRW